MDYGGVCLFSGLIMILGFMISILAFKFCCVFFYPWSFYFLPFLHLVSPKITLVKKQGASRLGLLGIHISILIPLKRILKLVFVGVLSYFCLLFPFRALCLPDLTITLISDILLVSPIILSSFMVVPISV